MARRILAAFALLVAAGVVGVVVLWLMDALGAWRCWSLELGVTKTEKRQGTTQ